MSMAQPLLCISQNRLYKLKQIFPVVAGNIYFSNRIHRYKVIFDAAYARQVDYE